MRLGEVMIPNKHRKIAWLFFQWLILLFGWSFSQPSWTAPPAAKVIPVEAGVVKLDTAIEEVSAIGNLLPEESVVIRPEIPGRINQLLFSEGETVKKGDILVTLDDSEYVARLSENDTQVKLNRTNFERIQELYDKKVISRKEYDETKSKLDQSLAGSTIDRVYLEKTKILAPFTGTIGLRNVSVGAYVQAGQDLATLANNSSLKLDFRISEKFLPNTKLGQLVNVTVDAYPQKTFVGKVYAFDVTVDEETRTLLLRARIPNKEGKLYPGMFARVSLIIAERANAIFVPEQAIVSQGENNYVFKIISEGNEFKALLTQVTMGQRRAGEVEITEGLKKNDKIVITGQMKLRNGGTVKIVNETSNQGKP